MPSTTDFGFFIALITSLYYAFIKFSQLQFIAVAITLSIFTHLLTSGGRGRKMPPGPTGLPIFGNILWFLFTDPNKYLNKLHKQYGKIFTIRMGSTYRYIISDYEMIKEMSNHPDFQHRPAEGISREIHKGRGIIDAEGDLWKHQRRFVLHALRDVGMGKLKLEENIQDEMSRLCLQIQKANGVPIDMKSLLLCSTCNMMFSLAFNKTYKYEDPKFFERIKQLDENINTLGKAQIIMFFPWLVPFFSGVIQRMKNNVEDIDKFQTGEIIKEHQKDFDPENPRDFLDLYLIEMSKEVTEENNDALKTFDIDQLEHVMGDLFAAGTETSSTTIRWAFTPRDKCL